MPSWKGTRAGVAALLFGLVALSPVMVPVAHAQDEEEDDGGETRSPKIESQAEVREIVRGMYAKSGVGSAMFLGNFRQASSPGTFVSMAVGQDFVDQERQSMAWELALTQSVNNGDDLETQYLEYNDGAPGCKSLGNGNAPCIQGDMRTYGVQATYEYSFYPTRRVGVGVRANGGVFYAPLFIETDAWDNAIAEAGGDPGMHNSVKPFVGGGPTVEYYTKLSHFSVGVDVDVFYGIGWDLGLNASGALKYTF